MTFNRRLGFEPTRIDPSLTLEFKVPSRPAKCVWLDPNQLDVLEPDTSNVPKRLLPPELQARVDTLFDNDSSGLY